MSDELENKINGFDFTDRIDQLELSYHKIIAAKNFFSDFPSEIRHAISNISDRDGVFQDVRDSVKKAENTLLIDAYTIAEQMLKNTKYQFLGYDDTEKSDLQLFLNHKIGPEKFSPNPKIDEVNKFLRRYNSAGLFLNKIPVYDAMIKARHRYAHSGTYQFSIEDVPRIIEVLRYLEFEYRMFLSKGPWFQLFVEIKKHVGTDGTIQQRQTRYEKVLPHLVSLSQESAFILSDEDTLAIKFGLNVISEIRLSSEISSYENGMRSARSIVKNEYS